MDIVEIISEYQWQGTMVEFMVAGAIVGAVIQLIASLSRGEYPLGELVMPGIAGAIISMMVFFFYSGTKTGI